MNTWQLLAIFTPLLFVTYQTISKFLPKESPIFLVNAIASLIGAFIMFILHLTLSGKTQVLSMRTFPLIILIGVLISVGNFLIIKAYSLGAPQSSFTSLFYPLLIIYGVIYGFILWHERFNWIQLLGFMLVLSGLVL